jgi:hypothetical protein
VSTKPSTGRVRSTYAFIKAHRDQYSMQTMCRVLGVGLSRQGHVRGGLRTSTRTVVRMPVHTDLVKVVIHEGKHLSDIGIDLRK